MPISLEITFAATNSAPMANTALIVEDGAKLGPSGKSLDQKSNGQLARSIKAAEFKGKANTSTTILALAGTEIDRLILVGAGKTEDAGEQEWALVGGHAVGQLAQTKAQAGSIVLDVSSLGSSAASDAASAIAMGALMRSYTFDIYKTKKSTDDKDGNDGKSDRKLKQLTIITPDVEAAREKFERSKAIADGVAIARDLVNEPANTLGPIEFAQRCQQLAKVGVEVEILDAAQLKDIGMHALLAVAQGSERPARVAVMQWQGAKSKRTKPLCFIGKGVVFDTGGISMKPAGGMEDMKGDMGGAACVTGLMHALAARKAAINAVGIVGLVENMPSGNAQRPGDIISSLSGQTIEVLNTDAEGRLVLADLLTYAQREFSPRFMINLATLTGAIIVALGKDHAGMFSNNDRLCDDLSACGLAIGEKVWRLPLGKAYDKMIDTPNADMKNIGGRWAGSITAAQFLQRFVDDTPWVHLDVAGTAIASEKTEISRTWASGWGVRLLDRLVAEKYER